MEQEPSESSAQRHLVVGDIVSESFRSVFYTYLRNLPAAAAAPFVLSVVIVLVFGTPQLETYGDEGSARKFLISVILFFLSALPYVLFAVAWHRLILLGPTAAPSFIPVWSRRHWRFFGFCFAWGALSTFIFLAVVAFPLALIERVIDSRLITGLAALLLFVAAGAQCLRLSLVLPANAVDLRYGLQEALRDSEQQGVRLVAIFVVTLIPFVIVRAGFEFLFELIAPDSVDQIIDPTKSQIMVAGAFVVGTVIHYLNTAVGVTFVSISFRRLTDWQPETPTTDTPMTNEPDPETH